MMQLPPPLYTTIQGKAYVGDSLELLACLQSESVDLVITSPPFALLSPKEYGNPTQDVYVDWLLKFTREVKRVIKASGSFVLDLGGAYRRGKPIRSLYNYRVLIRLCDEQGWGLAQEFFWFNPASIPTGQWVITRKIRAKGAVDTVWWLSKSDFPKADITKVLVPYSESSKKRLFEKGTRPYTISESPSGHSVSTRIYEDRGGAIPPNLLRIANSDSKSHYFQCCKTARVKTHPARFPPKLPEFFIKFLTDEGDVVLDIFAGSNTTGAVAEGLGRQWIAFELEQRYLAASALRFLPAVAKDTIRDLYTQLCVKGASNVVIPQAVQPRLI